MKPAFILLLLATFALAASPDANRLAYLDDASPYWPTPAAPRLITPRWIGEPGVEAAIVLAIDDMRAPAKYEAFLRPTLDRLKRIDGRLRSVLYHGQRGGSGRSSVADLAGGGLID